MITRLKEWGTENKKVVLLIILLILTSTLSFGLGYISNREFNHAPIIIERCSN